MRSRVITAVACVVVLLVGSAVALGLTSPDGSVDGATAPNVVTSRTTPTPTATTPSPVVTPTPSPSVVKNNPNLAPSSVSELWAGRPKAAALEGDRVDWCPAVKVSGPKSTKKAACAAVAFVFDHRYSRLSLPRKSYERSDFSAVLKSISSNTRQTAYDSRLSSFLSSPSRAAGENLGLVTLQGNPGIGYRFYGPANSTKGYKDRSVWINPTWSTVRTRQDFSRAAPRVVASFSASASIPVYNTGRKRDAMMTVPSTVTLTMREDNGKWKVASFQIHRTPPTFGSLAVR